MARLVDRKTALVARIVYDTVEAAGIRGATVYEVARATGLRPCDVEHALIYADNCGLIMCEDEYGRLYVYSEDFLLAWNRTH